MSNMRLTEKQCFDICGSCIRFLDEKYSSEGGLFRTSVSLTDVRGLRKQVLESEFEQFRDDIDPHLVAELLQVALKEMRLSLFHEVYDQVMDTELDADSIEYSINSIVPWLNSIPDHKYALTDGLFSLLEKLSTVDDNDTNLIQLGYCMSPVVCRPAGNAFMSIRHMEDLKNIRPIITFMIENHGEIFVRKVDDGTYKSSFAQDGSVRSTRSDSGDLEISAVSASMSTAMLLEASASGSVSGAPAKSSPQNSPKIPALSLHGVTNPSTDTSPQNAVTDAGPSAGLGFFANKPNLKVFVPPLKALEAADSDSLGLDMESDPTVQQYSYSENEWKIFEGLLCAKINTFIDPDDVDPFSRSWSGSTDIDFTFKGSGSGKLFSSPSQQQHQSGLIIDRADSPMGGVISADDIFSGRERTSSDDSPNAADMLVNPSSSDGPGTPNSVGESTPSSARQGDNGSSSNSSDSASASPAIPQSAERVALRFRRRKMVADCKGLRSQIFEFEQEWLKNHGRVPKGTERSPIQTVYTRYKELKKEIRDYAANDMQRCCRGHLARVRLKTVTKFKYYRNADDGKLISVKIDASSVQQEAQQQWARPTNNNNAGGGVTSPQHQQSGAAAVAAAGGPGGPIGSPQNGVKAVMPNGEGSSIPMDVYTNYSELLSSKRDLKRKLKKFDEDFVVQWGRNPRKADKEVIRPMYQKYHEIKTSLDELRAVIESSHGPLPSALQDDGAMMSGVASSRSSNSLNSSDTAASSVSAAESGEGAITISSPDGSHINSSSSGAASAPAQGSGAAAASRLGNIATPPVNSGKAPPGSMEALQEEKRNLHAYLKVYERDFNKLHGRPVMKHEDIQPVAHEYQRYKELKALIKDVKHTKATSGAVDGSSTSADSGNSD